MAYKIQTGKPASERIIRIYNYIGLNWGSRTADKFFDKLAFRVRQIHKHPEIGRPSKKKSQFRRITVAKFNIIYYRIKGSTIIIESLYDSRADPQKNPYD
jgi:plasmid stabilization system protein ParE